MKKLYSKVVLILMVVLFTISMCNVVNAAAEGMQVLNSNDKYLIYIDGLLEDTYYYAIEDSADVSEDDLNWITAKEDTEGNKVVEVAKEQANSYLWVMVNNEITKKAEPINLEDAVALEEVNEMRTLTNRIDVATDNVTETTREDDVIRKVTQGTLKVADSKNATYSYQIVLLNDKNSDYVQLEELANKIGTEMNMYENIELTKQYNELWNKILDNAEFSKVKDGTIMQPEDAENGTKYAVLLRKEENGKTTYDVQFLTSYKEVEKTETTETVKKEVKTALPVTFDNPILFIALGVVLVAIVIVAIRMRKVSKKNEK